MKTSRNAVWIGIAVGSCFWIHSLFSAEKPTPAYNRDTAKTKFLRPDKLNFPADNEPTAERVELGKALFFDPRLSRANTMSCASCHNPSFAWGDALPRGVGHGHKELGRRTPTILNCGYSEVFFWDGRAGSLEEQALGPIEAAGEMNLPLDEMIEKLRRVNGYAPLFEKAYPGEGITTKTVAKAIASFERTVISEPAPFDRWIAGQENVISDSAKRGFDLFNTKANCVKCHSGWNFTDDSFHDIGVPGDDIGRGKLLPQIQAMQFAFKTPTLRNADERRPFLHDGSERTLEDVVRFYNAGGKVHRPSLSADIKPLGLTQQEMDELCDFMRTLSSPDKPVVLPILPR